MSESEESFDDFLFDPAVVVGVWANGTRVLHGRDEFTIDFLRDIPPRSRRALVTRALVPLVAAFELRDQLDEALGSYTDWSMPRDANDG